jgi:hypothetical protein
VIVALGVAVAAVGGCAGPRIRDGVFHSDKGYTVAVPGAAWQLVRDSRADLEFRHGTEPAGMLVKASCGDVPQRPSLEALARHLLAGMRERALVSAEKISVNGKLAYHAVLDGRVEGEDRVRVELYVMRDERCLYDFLYVAPPASFDEWRPAFERLVETFRTE